MDQQGLGIQSKKNRPLRALLRVIPFSKVVAEILLATPFKFTRDSRSESDQ